MATSNASLSQVDDLRTLGVAKGWCPYFTTRRLIAQANVVSASDCACV